MAVFCDTSAGEKCVQMVTACHIKKETISPSLVSSGQLTDSDPENTIKSYSTPRFENEIDTTSSNIFGREKRSLAFY